MAEWNEYTDLFSENESPVIHEIQIIAENVFFYDTFETFRSNFNSIPFNDFITEEYADAFFTSLNSWLVLEANESGDWNHFRSFFNPKDYPYIDLIIAEYSNNGESITDFIEQSNETRINTIKSINGFMNAFKTTLSSYMDELPFPIIINTQPSSVTVCVGETSSLYLDASGDSINYQWKKNGSILSGENSATLQFGETVNENEGSYECVLSSNDGYSITTNAVTLTVNAVVSIIQQPTSKEVDWNTNYTLTIEASSDTTIQYQWRKDGLSISGATSSTYTLQNVRTNASGQYDCILTDDCGQIISSKATVSVTSFDSQIGVIHGKVEKNNEAPIAGIVVKVIDKKPGSTKIIGFTVTNSNGEYYLEYLTSALLDQQSFLANLVVQLFEQGADDPSLVSSMIEEASLEEEVNFTTDVFVETETEFSRVFTLLDEAVDPGTDLADLDNDDIRLLANKSISEEQISLYITSVQLNIDIPTVTVESFYGLLRLGAPSEVEELGAFANTELQSLLLKASNQNLISTIDDATALVVANSLKDDAIIQVADVENNSFGKVFQKVSLTTEKKNKIVEAYLNASPEDTDVLESISEAHVTGGLNSTEISEIKRVISIQDLDPTNTELIDVLDVQESAPSIEDLTSKNVADWEALIDDDDENLLTIPGRFTGTEEEKKTAYATELRRSVEILAPTKVLINQISSDSDIDSTEVDQFFASYPDFKFENDKVANFIHDNELTESDTVVQAVEKVQRLFHIAPEYDKFNVVKSLLNEGVDSSVKIATMGHSQFVSKLSSSLEANIIEDVWDNAMQNYGKVINTVVKYQNTPGPLVIGKNSVDNSGSVPGIANLETLFGSLDYCECKHCRSIHSPAAYLADLLNFIEDYAEHFDPTDTSTPKTAIATYYLKQKLLDNRPEIQNLHLNCENTNTLIPYIDIVNEILEHAINNKILAAEDASIDVIENILQTEHTAETLRARAQNKIEDVYQQLKDEVAPVNLPFNLSFEETKSYVEESGISLSELIKVLPKGNLSDEEHEAIVAASYFGIPLQQLNIINGNRTDIIPLGQTDPELSYTDLYKVASMAELVNPLGKFLDLTNVELKEFEMLILSRYINPDKKIIHFPADGSCNLDDMTFGHNPDEFANPESDSTFNSAEGFSEEELVKFNRFLRLYKLTGWSVKDLDLVINALGDDTHTPDKLNNQTVVALYQIEQLKKQFNLEVEELLIWWKNFDIHTYVDENLMDRLFQNVQVNHEPGDLTVPGLESIIANTPTVQLDDLNIKPLVQGAVKLSAREIDLIFDSGEVSTSITVQNLSQLFRISSFIKANRLSIEEYFEFKETTSLSGISTISTISLPSDTLEFLKKKELLKKSFFSIEEVAYLIRPDFSEQYSLSEDKVEEFLKLIRDKYDDLGIVKSPKISITAENLEAELTELKDLYITDSLVAYVDAIIDNSQNFDKNSDNAVNSFGKLMLSIEMDHIEASLSSVSEVEKRRQIVYNYFQRYHLIQTIVGASFTEDFALFFDLPTEVASELVEMTTTHNSLSIKELFLSLDFLLNEDDLDAVSYDSQRNLLRRIEKITLLHEKLNFSSKGMKYLVNDLPAEIMQLIDLPVDAETAISFSDFELFIQLGLFDSKSFSDTSLLDYLSLHADATMSISDRKAGLAEITGWNLTDINAISSSSGFNYDATPSEFEKTDWIYQLDETFSVLEEAGIDVSTAINLAFTNPDSETSFTMRNILKSKFGTKQWLKIAEKVHDPIREAKRDAMVAFLVNDTTFFDFESEKELYDYFLIDTQMSSCQLSSRIKQAISATQLFIQRIQLGFEENLFLSKQKMQEWDWIKNYRVWEANRKVFLYPENYLLPELRTNQSQLFTNFVETLNQEEVTTELASDAYQRYLEELPSVTNLEVNQMTYDDYTGVMHIIANDQQDPKQFFYRTCKDQSFWTPWELIPINLEGAVLPVIHRSKLMLFWLETKEVKSQPTSIKPIAAADYENENVIKKVSDSQLDVRLAWTTKEKNTWEAKKITEVITTEANKAEIEKLVLSPMINQHGELFITILDTENTFDGLELFKAFKLVLGNFESIAVDEGNNLSADELFIRESEYIDNTGDDKYLTGFDDSNSLPNWATRRKFNLAQESGIFNIGENRELSFSKQKLNLPLQSKLSIPHRIYFNIPSGLNEIKKAFFIESATVLSSLINRKFTLIRPIKEEFPMLNYGGFDKPFILKESSKYYVVFIQNIKENSEFINITRSRILRGAELHSTNVGNANTDL